MDETQARTRRSLLAAAAGSAAALAAQAALGPAAAVAADQPLLVNVPNGATASTELAALLEAGPVLKIQNDAANGGGTAVTAVAGPGAGLLGSATTGSGVVGRASQAPGRGVSGESPVTGTGVFGVAGEPTNGPADASFTGVFGYADAGDGDTTMGAGVWGDSPDVGVYGTGGTGVVGDGGTSGWGLYGYSGSSYGLYVTGKVKFATRSGRNSVAKGKTRWTKSTGLAGVTSSNIVIAVLQTSEAGTWVRAAVASTGKITVYFNRALPSSSYVGWLILG